MAPGNQPSKKQNSEQNKSLWVQMARYSELAFIFPATLVVGWLAGELLDRWLHTTWLYLVGVLVGIVAGFVALIRIVMRDST